MTAGEPRTSFRSRSAYRGHLVVGSGDSAVLIEPAVAGELRMAAALAGGRPTAGLLYGHYYHDDEGGYTLVEGFVPAESAGIAAAEADLVAARGRLREEAARNYPGTEEVGWWRTAPRPGEEGWPDAGAWPLSERPDGIGLVVFADGTPPAADVLALRHVVQGTVVEDRLIQAPLRQETAPLQSAPPPAPEARPTRGRTGPPVQSPMLVNSDELRSQRRHEPERGGLLELEAQQWVALAIVVLVLVIVITVAVLVSRAFH